MGKIIKGISLSGVKVSCDYTSLTTVQTALTTVADLEGGYLKEYGDGTAFTVKFYNASNVEVSTISADGTILPEYAGVVLNVNENARSYEYLSRLVNQKRYLFTEDMERVDVSEIIETYDSDLDGVLNPESLPVATESQKGAMAASDKVKLDGIAAGATRVTVDSSLSPTSTNAVQNKVINTALGNKVDKVSGKGLSTNDFTTAEKTKLAGIATGATKVTVDSALSSTSTNPVRNSAINAAITSINNTLANKVDKVAGKGLSTNDFTTALKTKVDGLGTPYYSDGTDFTDAGNPTPEKNCADTTNTDLMAVNLPAGTWLIIATVRWTNTNQTGMRVAQVSTSTNKSDTNGVYTDIRGCGAYYTNNRVVRVVRHTDTTAYHLVAYQTSGTTLKAKGAFCCVRLC